MPSSAKQHQKSRQYLHEITFKKTTEAMMKKISDEKA